MKWQLQWIFFYYCDGSLITLTTTTTKPGQRKQTLQKHWLSTKETACQKSVNSKKPEQQDKLARRLQPYQPSWYY